MKLEISQVRPCVSNEDKIMAKVQINRIVNLSDLSEKLSSVFESVVNSDDLNAIKIETHGSVILIFSSGEIVMRQMDSEKDIFELAKQIDSLV